LIQMYARGLKRAKLDGLEARDGADRRSPQATLQPLHFYLARDYLVMSDHTTSSIKCRMKDITQREDLHTLAAVPVIWGNRAPRLLLPCRSSRRHVVVCTSRVLRDGRYWTACAHTTSARHIDVQEDCRTDQRHPPSLTIRYCRHSRVKVTPPCSVAQRHTMKHTDSDYKRAAP
jgi:hypothetical protein